MSKIKINVSLYLLFAANCIYAVSEHNFNWLFWAAAVLTAAVLILDIWGVIRHGREK